MKHLGKRVIVLGMARSGRAAAAALERRGVEVVRADRRPRRLGDEAPCLSEDEVSLDGVELLVKSPGVPGANPLVGEARRRGVPVWSELELGFRLVEAARFLAVTGTNGKTTTCELLGAILGAPVAGNVGRAVCELDGRVEPGAWVVCEVSSFQLEDVHSFHPAVAVLLNLEPDHLDRHGTVEAYRAAKLRVFENQTRGDTAVVPRGFGPIPGAARRVEFDGGDPLPAAPLIPGEHNRENAAAATAAARAVGVDDRRIGEALRTFPGVEHRLELVAEIGGVRWINDSKATNTTAARRGIAAYAAEPLHVILGGSRKGETFDPLARELPPTLRGAYLIGETEEELAGALERAGVRFARAGDLGTAVVLAASAAREGDVVLLSPACASYDQFANFEERGQEFRRLVQNLAG